MNNTVAIRLAVEGGSVVSSELNQITGRLGTLGQAAQGSTASAERFASALGNVGQAAQAGTANTDRLSAAFGRVAGYGLAGGGLIALAGTVKAVSGALFEASASAQRLTTQLNFATGGNSAKEMAFVSGVANQLGLELASTAKAYAGFASAARGSTLEGLKARAVFESIASASAVMGLSTDETSGALLAIQQMMSKGVVSAEEFRGQLGERMPIALQAGANALGVTTAEFSKLMETGQIVAADFLPKFAVAIKEMLGDSVTAAADRLDAGVARMGNAWEKLKRTVGDAGVSKSLANEAAGMSNYMDALSDSMNRASQSGSGLLGVLNAGLAQTLARMPFDVVSASSNLLNGAINALTGNVMHLKTNLDLLPTSFKSNAQQALALTGQLKAAEADLSALTQRLGQQPTSIYLQSEAHQAYLLVEQLRAAKKAQDDLAGGGAGRGSVNPQTIEEASAAQNRFNAAMDKYATKTEKANTAVEALRKAYGSLFTPEWEKKVRASIDTPATGVSEAAKGLALYNDLTAKAGALNADFTEKWNLLGAALHSNKINVNQLTAAQSELLKEQTFAKAAAKEWADQAKESAKAVEDSIKAYDREVASLQQSADSVATHVQKLQDEEAASRMAAAQNISLAEAIELVTIARLKEQQAAAYAAGNQESGDAIKQEINNRRELAGLINSKEARDASTKAAKDAAEAATNEWRKAAEKINDSITDALMRGFESGKDFAAVLRDTVVNMFKTMVLRPVISALVSPMGAATAGLFGSGGAAAGQGAQGGALGQLSVVQSLKGLYDMVTGGFESLSLAVNNGLIEIGANVGQYSAAAGETIIGSASTIGTAAGYAGGILAGKVVGDAISGGFGVNGTGSAVVNIGTVVGAIAGGPIGAAIGGAIGGLFNRAFGSGETQVRAQGTRGTFAGSGFSGNNYATMHQDGGWFSSDKNWTETSALDAASSQALSSGFVSVKNAVMGSAKSLGLAASTIADYSKTVDIAAGTTKESLLAMFTGMADEMALLVAPSLGTVAKADETASATLNRLSASLSAVNSRLSILQQRTLQISVAGADAASKLADLFGGLDGFTSAAKAFYDTYYTEGARAAQSQQDLAKAMALFNLTLPTTKDAFKDLAASLDLNTEYGRQAYAVLLAIAPEFATTTDAMAKMAADTAKTLLATFSGNGQLVPVLNSAALKLGNVRTSTQAVTTALGSINAVLLDSSSAVLTFSRTTEVLDGQLTASQQSAGLLTEQIGALKDRAGAAQINIAGLAEALQSVNTETFVAAITGVFEGLATRIGKVIGDISTERIAVREAALQIVNPTVMGKAQIERGIAGVGTGLPSNAGVVAANQSLATADQNYQSNDTRMSADLRAYNKSLSDHKTNLIDLATKYTALSAEYVTQQQKYGGVYANISLEQGGAVRNGGQYDAATNRISDNRAFTSTWGNQGWSDLAGFNADPKTAELRGQLQSGNRQLIAAEEYISTYTWIVAETEKTRSDSNMRLLAEQTTAQAAAKKSALDYAAALQQFALDASKSVSRLSKLREETVKYYEAQKALSSLMASSASGLRSTVASYQYSRLSPEDQLASLQNQFSSAYSMALSTSGETLAGYGDTLNGLLAPLLEKAQEVLGSGSAYNTLANTSIARAETVAGQLESTAPTNYAADSLAMLDSIDTSLAALDASSVTAERLISDTIKAGTDKTATGLNAIVQALTGKAIPGYALGGDFAGGLRIVGENGPELEATGPSRIFNATQTRGMLQGNGSGDMVLELRALRADNADMRAELRAIANSNARMAKLAERADQDGTLVRTESVQPLHIVSTWA